MTRSKFNLYHFIFLFACLRIRLIFIKIYHFIFITKDRTDHFWLLLQTMFSWHILRIQNRIIVRILNSFAVLLMTQTQIPLNDLWLILIHFLLNFLFNLTFIQRTSSGDRHAETSYVIFLDLVSVRAKLSLLRWLNYSLL